MERTIDCERDNGMPDLLHSTKHSWHSRRLNTSAQTLAHGCIGGGILCNFAHLSGNIFAPPRLRDSNMESDDARRESHCSSNQPESIIATAASGYKARRSVLRKNGTDASSKQDA
jgi:hypothetical protein